MSSTPAWSGSYSTSRTILCPTSREAAEGFSAGIGGRATSEPNPVRVTWTKLEIKRENLITSLRDVEQEMTAMNPVVKALFGRSKELEAA